MPASAAFKIYVMGDAGDDIYTWADVGSRSARPSDQEHLSDMARDVTIPSGAGFVYEALSKFFGGDVVRLSHLQAMRPLNAGNAPIDAKYLVPARPLDPILTHLMEFAAGERKIDRIQRFIALQRFAQSGSPAALTGGNSYGHFQVEEKTNWIDLRPLNEAARKILIFHHGAGAWDEETKLPSEHLEATKAIAPLYGQFVGDGLQILVNVKQLPEIKKWAAAGPQFQSVFWKELFAARARTGVVVSLSALRRRGADISHGLSWEQTVLDFCSELRLFPCLQALSQFRDLFVRVDTVGLIHLSNAGGAPKARLYFETYSKAQRNRDPEDQGRIVGKNTLLLASIAAQLRRETIAASDFTAAIVAGLQAGARIYDRGYKRQDFLDRKEFKKGESRITEWLEPVADAVTKGAAIEDAPQFSMQEIPDDLLAGRKSTKHPSDWSILEARTDADKSMRCALAIIDAGVGSTNSADRLDVPILRFGKLILVDREEIEKFSGVKNLLGRYVNDRANNDKPVSIAVFGPPGTGKSFAVKEIADTIDPGRKLIESMEYNLAQFQTPGELGNALHRVGSVNNSGKTPLVFFDEFDCSLNKERLGWLKYFLAPMQDGNFYGAAGTINIGRGIFVFAGGNHWNFAEFKTKAAQFTDQKGPDFISRLRGHVDIQPINAEGADIPLIRRAVLLRGLLEKHNFIRKSHDGGDRSMLDNMVAYALLKIGKYQHGVRSMEAILQMSSPIDGRIQISSLPARSQLQMHVNADELYAQFLCGRQRLTPHPPEIVQLIDDMAKEVAEEITRRGAVSENVRDLRELVQSEMPTAEREWHRKLKDAVEKLNGLQLE